MKRFLISLMAILLIVFVAFAGLLVDNAPPGNGANAVSLIMTAAQRLPVPVLAIAADVLLATIAAVGVCWLFVASLENSQLNVRSSARNSISLTLRSLSATPQTVGKLLIETARAIAWRGWSLPLQTDWYVA